MKFSNILNSYIKENNLKVGLSKQQPAPPMLLEQYLIEAKAAKADLYKDLSISAEQAGITPEDVSDIKFYVKGKSAKDSKSPEETAKINSHQAALFNKIFEKVKASAVNGKTTLIGLTAAAQQVFAADGQNKPTQAYNMRGVLTALISKKKLLTPAGGGTVSGAAVLVDPEEGAPSIEEPTSSAEEPSPINSTEPPSKFDSAVQDNEPESSSERGGEFYKVEKGTSVTRDELKGGDRTLAAWLLSLIAQDLPGTHNKESITSEARERDSEVTPEEISSMLDRLVKMGKIKLVAKGVSDEAVPDEQDEEENTTPDLDPDDIVDRQLTGSSRKGFASKDYNFDF